MASGSRHSVLGNIGAIGTPLEDEEKLRTRVRSSTLVMKSTPLMRAAAEGILTPEQWKIFGIQRYMVAQVFVALLGAGMNLASGKDTHLHDILLRNFYDETGGDPAHATTALAHETWRQQFYSAMGITEEELGSTDPMDGTKVYLTFAQELIRRNDLLEIAGGVLMIEGGIPQEFDAIRRGLRRCIPDIFAGKIQEGDPDAQKKRDARLYLDDHITHDAGSHFPELLRAVAAPQRTEGEWERVYGGMDGIFHAKVEFYRSLGLDLLGDRPLEKRRGPRGKDPTRATRPFIKPPEDPELAGVYTLTRQLDKLAPSGDCGEGEQR